MLFTASILIGEEVQLLTKICLRITLLRKQELIQHQRVPAVRGVSFALATRGALRHGVRSVLLDLSQLRIRAQQGGGGGGGGEVNRCSCQG
jgi:hypothetical protein